MAKNNKAIKKLKWKTNKSFLDYGTERWENKCFVIERDSSATYLFVRKTIDLIGRFKKLSSAKKVAQLISNG